MSLPMFHEIATGGANATYDDTNQYLFDFTSRMVQLHFQSGTGPIYYSFNGSVDHGVLNDTPGSIQLQCLEPHRANRVWLRGGDGTELVEITALPKNE